MHGQGPYVGPEVAHLTSHLSYKWQFMDLIHLTHLQADLYPGDDKSVDLALPANRAA